jgi:hypothetical protein
MGVMAIYRQLRTASGLPTIRSECRNLLPALLSLLAKMPLPNPIKVDSELRFFEESGLQANASLQSSVLLALWC